MESRNPKLKLLGLSAMLSIAVAVFLSYGYIGLLNVTIQEKMLYASALSLLLGVVFGVMYFLEKDTEEDEKRKARRQTR